MRLGITTFSIITLSIMTVSVIILITMTFSVMIYAMTIFSITTLTIKTMNTKAPSIPVKCYAECRKSDMLSVIMTSVAVPRIKPLEIKLEKYDI